MARAFELSSDATTIDAVMDTDERDLVATVLTQVRTLIVAMDPPLPQPSGDPFADSVAFLGMEPQPQDDPALRRLFPDARADDASGADEFRRVTETGLRQRKVETIDAAVEALTSGDGDDVRLTPTQARALAVALTDVRLVLGSRLGLTTDDDHERLETLAEEGSLDPHTEHGLNLYEFLTWLQEGVAEALAQRWERTRPA